MRSPLAPRPSRLVRALAAAALGGLIAITTLAPASAAGPWTFPDNCRGYYYQGVTWASTTEYVGCWRTQAGVSYWRADNGQSILQVSGWSTYPTHVSATYTVAALNYSRHYGDATSGDCCSHSMTWHF